MAYAAVQRRAAQSVDTTFRISQQWRIRKQSLYPDGDPDRHQKFNQWFIGPLPTVPKIHANPFFAQSS